MWNSLFAIVAGSVVDYVGSPIVFLILGLFLPWLPLHGSDAIGLAMDVCGGLVTGLIAKRNKVGHSAVTGCIVFGLALVFVWRFPAQTADPSSVVLLIPAEMLGGWLAARVKPRGPAAPRGPAPPIASPF